MKYLLPGICRQIIIAGLGKNNTSAVRNITCAYVLCGDTTHCAQNMYKEFIIMLTILSISSHLCLRTWPATPIHQVSHQLPLGASVPSLGLSNKAVFTGEVFRSSLLFIYQSLLILLLNVFTLFPSMHLTSLPLSNPFPCSSCSLSPPLPHFFPFSDSLPQDEDDIATKNSFADQIPAFAPVDLSGM